MPDKIIIIFLLYVIKEWIILWTTEITNDLPVDEYLKIYFIQPVNQVFINFSVSNTISVIFNIGITFKDHISKNRNQETDKAHDTNRSFFRIKLVKQVTNNQKLNITVIRMSKSKNNLLNWYSNLIQIYFTC